MELRKLDVNQIMKRCKEETKDSIPSNWYISARQAWEMFAWAVVQIRNGTTIRSNKEAERFIHQYWEYIEEHAFAYGKENEE